MVKISAQLGIFWKKIENNFFLNDLVFKINVWEWLFLDKTLVFYP